MPISFEKWIEKVDFYIQQEIDMGIRDIPDNCYRDIHEMGYTPKEAARQTLDEVYYIF
jgi:hypothetical protein